MARVLLSTVLLLVLAPAVASALRISLGPRFYGVAAFQSSTTHGWTSVTTSVSGTMSIYDSQCSGSVNINLATASFTFSWADLIPGVDAAKCAIDTGELISTLSGSLGSCLDIYDATSALVDAARNAGTCPLQLASAVQTFSADLNACSGIVKAVLKEVADCSHAVGVKTTEDVAEEEEEDEGDHEAKVALMEQCNEMTGVADLTDPNKSETKDIWHTGVYVLGSAAAIFTTTTVVLSVYAFRLRKRVESAEAGAPHTNDYLELQ